MLGGWHIANVHNKYNRLLKVISMLMMWDDENRLGTLSSFVFGLCCYIKSYETVESSPDRQCHGGPVQESVWNTSFQMNRNLFGGLDGKKDNNECSIFLFIKGIVHPKKDSVIIYLFTLMTFQTCMTYFLLRNTKYYILKNVGKQNFPTLYFPCIFIQQKSMGTETLWLLTFFKVYFIFNRIKNIGLVWSSKD